MKEFGIADSGSGRTVKTQEEKEKPKGWILPAVILTQVSTDLSGKKCYTCE